VVTSKNIKLTIEYDGSAYAGWQFQPDQRTIQGELEAAVKKLTGRKVTLYGAGRTDAGVHARGQVANFAIAHTLQLSRYRDGLNFHLPEDIVIREAVAVPAEFHARYDAIFRRYEYSISTRRSALDSGQCWEFEADFDIGLLNAAADYIMGDRDFTTCCVVSSQKENNRCTVFLSRWVRDGDVLRYEIAADRFVHNMIRSLVGLMADVGRRAMTMTAFKGIFHSGDHTAIRRVAPARGLCLVAVEY
jgi:tRNA pseudouridine38-40 synthase